MRHSPAGQATAGDDIDGRLVQAYERVVERAEPLLRAARARADRGSGGGASPVLQAKVAADRGFLLQESADSRLLRAAEQAAGGGAREQSRGAKASSQQGVAKPGKRPPGAKQQQRAPRQQAAGGREETPGPAERSQGAAEEARGATAAGAEPAKRSTRSGKTVERAQSS